MRCYFFSIIVLLPLFLSCELKSSEGKTESNSLTNTIDSIELGDTLFLSFRENMSMDEFEEARKKLLKDQILSWQDDSVYPYTYSIFFNSKEIKGGISPIFNEDRLQGIYINFRHTTNENLEQYFEDFLRLYKDKYVFDENFEEQENVIASRRKKMDFGDHLLEVERTQMTRVGGDNPILLKSKYPIGFSMNASYLEKLIDPCEFGCERCEYYMSMSKDELEKEYKFKVGVNTHIHHFSSERNLMITAHYFTRKAKSKMEFREIEIRYLNDEQYLSYLTPKMKAQNEIERVEREKKNAERQSAEKHRLNEIRKNRRSKEFQNEL